jgi:malonate transporter
VINPIVWLPVSGMVLSFAHVTLPEPVLTSVDLIAKSAGGASLFALGLMLYGERFMINANVLTNLAIKNFVQPGLMVVGTILFGVVGAPAHQAVITGAVPTATAAAMFALKTKTYTADATATILISTILGIATEGLLIAYFF